MVTERILQKVVRFTTPVPCLGCGTEGDLLCASCRPAAVSYMAPECYRCTAQNLTYATCDDCRGQTPLARLAIVSRHEDLAQALIHRFKYDGDQAAGRLAATYMAELVSPTDYDLVTSAPTTPARRRQRGFDQAELLAREVAHQLGLPYRRTLVRLQPVHQLGATRDQRWAHAKNLFAATRSLAERRVLVIDDVVTTGATMTAAATALRSAGATSIHSLAMCREV